MFDLEHPLPKMATVRLATDQSLQELMDWLSQRLEDTVGYPFSDTSGIPHLRQPKSTITAPIERDEPNNPGDEDFDLGLYFLDRMNAHKCITIDATLYNKPSGEQQLLENVLWFETFDRKLDPKLPIGVTAGYTHSCFDKFFWALIDGILNNSDQSAEHTLEILAYQNHEDGSPLPYLLVSSAEENAIRDLPEHERSLVAWQSLIRSRRFYRYIDLAQFESDSLFSGSTQIQPTLDTGSIAPYPHLAEWELPVLDKDERTIVEYKRQGFFWKDIGPKINYAKETTRKKGSNAKKKLLAVSGSQPINDLHTKGWPYS